MNKSGEVTSSKLLGIFASTDAAIEAIGTFRALEGFRDHPGGFSAESVPVDQTIYNSVDFGLSAAVHDYLTGVEDLDRPIEKMIARGTLGIFGVVEEVHQQVPGLAAESIVFEVIHRWLKNAWPRRELRESRDLTPPTETAQLFWKLRRASYPESPQWDDPAYPSWSSMIAAYRRVLLFENLPSANTVVGLFEELVAEAKDEHEHAYLALGPLQSLFIVFGDEKTARTRLTATAGPAVKAFLKANGRDHPRSC